LIVIQIILIHCYYRILSGNIKNVSTLRESIGNLQMLNTKRIRLVMDKSFYSAPKTALYEGQYQFSVGVPFTTSLARDMVEENWEGMDSHHNLINVGGDELYAVTKYINERDTAATSIFIMTV